MMEVGGQHERDSMSRFEVYHKVRATEANGKCVRSRWIDEYKMKSGSYAVVWWHKNSRQTSGTIRSLASHH